MAKKPRIAPALAVSVAMLFASCAGPTPMSTPTPLFGSTSGFIAFVSGEGRQSDLFVMKADGSDINQLTNDPGTVNYISWSPDGQWIAFVSSRDGDQDIYTIKPNGSEERLLTHDTPPANPVHGYASDENPVWSPDSQWIAFQSNRKRHSIYIMRSDGSEETRLEHQGWLNGFPSWSPDGQWIVFTSSRRGPEVELFMVRPDGTELTQLTHNSVWELQPVWSPDGQWISFNTSSEVGGDLFVIKPDGSGEREIVSAPGMVINISWSPDSQWIAYASEQDGDYEIYLVRPDGSEELQLTNNQVDDIGAVWSPDGQWIAFVSREETEGSFLPGMTIPSNIFIIRPDGSGLIQLTNSPTAKGWISWSPIAGSP
ncbi:MAG: PD40 domain-containing protein [Chloroflexi bacterium]|nr:PD40 domain-containing protein [Chloroflexota bacterium]